MKLFKVVVFVSLIHLLSSRYIFFVSSDYASKQWSGLAGAYYLPRWQFFTDALVDVLQSGQAPSSFNATAYRAAMLQRVELPWQTAGDADAYPTQAQGDAIQIVLLLADKYAPFLG